MQAYDYSGHNFDATYGNSDGTVGSGCLDGGENIDINAQYGPNPNDYLNGYPGLPVNNGCAGLSSYFSNGYLTVPPLNLNTNTVTFTMWIHPNDPFGVIAPNSGLLMNRNGGDTAGVGFSGNQNANLTAALGYTWNNNSPATYGWNSLLYPVPQQWQFVAYVISPQNTTIYHCYVSGGQTNLYKAVNNITNAPEAFSGGTTWLGSDNWNNGRAFNGSIDEVAVFNRAMSENQIVDLFLKALGGLVPPPPTPWPVEPTNTTLFLGQMLQLTAIAGGIPAPHYQWQVWYNSTWMNLSGNPNLGIAPTTNTTLYWTNFVGAFSNFRCFATNYYYGWSSISSTATVTVIPPERPLCRSRSSGDQPLLECPAWEWRVWWHAIYQHVAQSPGRWRNRQRHQLWLNPHLYGSRRVRWFEQRPVGHLLFFCQCRGGLRLHERSEWDLQLGPIWHRRRRCRSRHHFHGQWRGPIRHQRTG
jgi:hypothetical protein